VNEEEGHEHVFTEDEKLTEARLGIERALDNYLRVRGEIGGEEAELTMTSWAVVLEFMSLEMSLFSVAGFLKEEKEHQMPSTSRGLYEFGVDAFRRG
jgi:hypothetical protein